MHTFIYVRLKTTLARSWSTRHKLESSEKREAQSKECFYRLALKE